MINLNQLDWVVFLDAQDEDEALPYKVMAMGHLKETGAVAVTLKNQKRTLKPVSPDRLRVISEAEAKSIYESTERSRYLPLLKMGASKSDMARETRFNPFIYP